MELPRRITRVLQSLGLLERLLLIAQPSLSMGQRLRSSALLPQASILLCCFLSPDDTLFIIAVIRQTICLVLFRHFPIMLQPIGEFDVCFWRNSSNFIPLFMATAAFLRASNDLDDGAPADRAPLMRLSPAGLLLCTCSSPVAH